MQFVGARLDQERPRAESTAPTIGNYSRTRHATAFNFSFPAQDRFPRSTNVSGGCADASSQNGACPSSDDETASQSSTREESSSSGEHVETASTVELSESAIPAASIHRLSVPDAEEESLSSYEQVKTASTLDVSVTAISATSSSGNRALTLERVTESDEDESSSEWDEEVQNSVFYEEEEEEEESDWEYSEEDYKDSECYSWERGCDTEEYCTSRLEYVDEADTYDDRAAKEISGTG